MKVIEVLSCLTFLAAFTSGVEIECEYHINDWYYGSLYECSATVLNAENPATVTDITGTHMPGERNEDVTGFRMSDQMLTKIPKGIENFFPDLEVFEWSYGNISTIDSSTFDPFKNLLGIYLGDNKLVTLDGDLFQHTRKLRQIAVYENLIQHVGHDLLTGLTDLTYADFGSNPCTELWTFGPQEIEELKIQLPIQCPPLAATPDPSTTTITPEPTTEWIEPETSPITTRSTPSTTTTPRNRNDVTISFVCLDDGFGSIPNANFCSRYFECNRGIRFAKKCPAGQVFDVITSRCGDPDTSLCALNIRCV